MHSKSHLAFWSEQLIGYPFTDNQFLSVTFTEIGLREERQTG